MKEPHQQNRFVLNLKSYGLAIAVHVLLLGIIMFNLFWNPTRKIDMGQGQVQPIQAQVINETLVNQELNRIREEEQEKLQEEIEQQQKLEELEQQALLKEQEIKKLEEEAKKQEEQVKAEQKKAEQLAEQRKIEEEKTKEAEKKRLAEEARLKELAIQKEKEEQEKKRKAEELAKQKEAEKKRKAEEEKKRQAELAKKKAAEEEKRKQAEAEKKRKQAAEQARLAEQQAQQQASSLFAQYIGPIRNKVTNSWVRPGSLRPGAQAKVLVRVSPQGDVLTARIQKGSGDPIFDRSVINAVYKASPLPIPNDPRLYPHYRDFVFNFDPPG